MNEYQRELFDRFYAAHTAPDPLILVNCWDPASAAVISSHPTCEAIGTSSAGVAWSEGLRDGEALTPDRVISSVAAICAASERPVTVDIEGGYVETAQVGEFVAELSACGAVGVNIEDVHEGRLLPAGEAAERISAIRSSSESVGRPVFVNARTDAFWRPDLFDDLPDDALERIDAFTDAGAQGVFLPGVSRRGERRTLVQASSLPMNFLLPPTSSIEELTNDGAARISLGSGPFRAAMASIDRIASAAFAREDVAIEAISYANMQRLMSRSQRGGDIG